MQGLEQAFAVLATQIRAARRAKGLRQEEVARTAGLGTSTVRMIERGTHHGTGLVGMLAVLRAVGLPLNTLDPLMEQIQYNSPSS
ncbi:helix-turn-helix domain-containing protein [Curtobacterium flaccumfaciens pv. flaccumfaciens]|uniref:helix-turn-helix domain-containing protein n=1 Tax=Curtobacterium flaccumfaciens TaxID=2035 RepID=UPI003AB58E9C